VPQPLVLVTGFGPFRDVARNPSGELAEALALDPPAGVEVVGRVLPVSFAAAPPALEAAIERLAPRVPDAILGLGVQRGAWFRLERRARAVLDSEKPDLDGRFARELEPLGARDLECALDLERLCAAMRAAGAGEARASDQAGGYVCERVFRAALEAGARLGLPGLFLHLPPADLVSVDDQLPVLRGLLVELAAMVRAPDPL